MEDDVRQFADWFCLHYGQDFRLYRHATLASRLRHICTRLELDGPRALRDWLSRHPGEVDGVVDQLCVPVSELFREPETFADLRRLVFPHLSSFPSITVWHAGCAAGQEAYSMAILLAEAGLLSRSRIFASDISADALARAARGLLPIEQVQAAQPRYQDAGGSGRLERHFRPRGSHMLLDSELMSHISFVRHNLATDWVFCEANLILCRNVLIYFQPELQARALDIFVDSLVRCGRLCLGQREQTLAGVHRFARESGSSWIYFPMRPAGQPLHAGGLVLRQMKG